MISRIFVARDKTRRAVEHALAGDRRVVIVALRRAIDDRPSTLDALYSVGVLANVVDRRHRSMALSSSLSAGFGEQA
jgi:ATP-dependent Lon protease